MQWVGYDFCLSTSGEIWAVYKYFDSNGLWHEETLLHSSSVAQRFDVTQWTSIAIITFGNELAFWVNYELMGVATHNGPLSGSVGLYVVDLGDQGADFLFRDLLIWAIE